MAGLKIKKGDKVLVISGKDKGKQGEVLKVLREESRVIVKGVNIIKRHQKARKMGENSGIISKEASIHVSNVSLLDPKSGKASRIGYKFLENGDKVRYAKRSGEVLA